MWMFSCPNIICWGDLSFPHWMALPSLLKINWWYMLGFISRPSILFHWSMCLFLCQHHTVSLLWFCSKFSNQKYESSNFVLCYFFKFCFITNILMWSSGLVAKLCLTLPTPWNVAAVLLHCRQILYQQSHQGSPVWSGVSLWFSNCFFLMMSDVEYLFMCLLVPSMSSWRSVISPLYNWVALCPGSVQFSSVAQSCPTLCDPMNCSTPGLPVHHQLPEFTQTLVHWVGDAIQQSHPLSSPSPPAPNPSQHQSLFQWFNSSHEMAKVLEFQL